MPSATGTIPSKIPDFDVLAQHHPGEQHAKRRHQEVIGARRGRAAHLEQMKPQEIGQDRSAQREERERTHETRVRHDIADIVQREREREQHDTRGQVLDAVADPEAALRRQQLEQDGAGHDRRQRREREQDAVQAVGADRHAMPDDEADTENAEQEPGNLAPGELLSEQERGQHGGEHRIGADDQAAEAGRYGLQAGIAEAQIKRVVGDAENRKHQSIAPGQRPGIAAHRGNSENQNSRERKSRGQQNKRRTIGDADFSRDKGKTPEQAEQADIERQRIEGGAGNRDGWSERHGIFPWKFSLFLPM